MSAKLLKLRLQFFADPTEDTETPYISEGTGGKSTIEDYMTQNNRVNKETYYTQNNFLGTQKEWEKYYGFDADRDYQNTVNTLNYEYQTSMATYGKNAENLYQMGLSNSGVSDIFQANAFSAYLANMNTAAQTRINTKNQLKRDYGQYVDGFNKGWMEYDAATQSGYNTYSSDYDTNMQTNSVNGYLAVLEAGIFSGEKIEDYTAAEGASVGAGFKDYHKVSNYLKNLGYDDATIESIWARLARMDLAGLKTDRENAGYLNTQGIYNGTEESEKPLRAILQAMQLTESEIENIVKRHIDEWNASEDGQNAAIKNLFTSWTEAGDFDPSVSMDDYISGKGIDITNKESQEYKNAVAAWELMSSNYKTRMGEIDTLIYGLFRDDSGISTWSDSAEQNNALNDFFTTQGLNEKEQQYVRDKLNERKVNHETAVNETVKNSLNDIKLKNGFLTYGDYMNASAAAEGDAKNEYQGSAVGLVKDVMSGEIELDEADGYLAGFMNSDGWDDLSDDEKRRKIVEAAMKDQNMTATDRNEIVSSYISKKTKDILAFDANNSGETGLADAGALVTYIKGLGLKSDEEKTVIGSIIEKVGISYKAPQITWNGDGEATLSISSTAGNIVTNNTIIERLNSQSEENHGSIQSLDGKLYIYGSIAENRYGWREVSESDIKVLFDWHTNTDEERRGTYDLLVVLFDPNRGYSSGN